MAPEWCNDAGSGEGRADLMTDAPDQQSWQRCPDTTDTAFMQRAWLRSVYMLCRTVWELEVSEAEVNPDLEVAIEVGLRTFLVSSQSDLPSESVQVIPHSGSVVIYAACDPNRCAEMISFWLLSARKQELVPDRWSHLARTSCNRQPFLTSKKQKAGFRLEHAPAERPA